MSTFPEKSQTSKSRRGSIRPYANRTKIVCFGGTSVVEEARVSPVGRRNSSPRRNSICFRCASSPSNSEACSALLKIPFPHLLMMCQSGRGCKKILGQRGFGTVMESRKIYSCKFQLWTSYSNVKFFDENFFPANSKHFLELRKNMKFPFPVHNLPVQGCNLILECFAQNRPHTRGGNRAGPGFATGP